MTGNLLYAQSGGVTAVINASAAGVIAEARLQPERIGRVLAARNGILGVLRETLVDTASLLDPDLRRLRATPGGAFGSCRFDLDPKKQPGPVRACSRCWRPTTCATFFTTAATARWKPAARCRPPPTRGAMR
jgi:6-phosphofructokinase